MPVNDLISRENQPQEQSLDNENQAGGLQNFTAGGMPMMQGRAPEFMMQGNNAFVNEVNNKSVANIDREPSIVAYDMDNLDYTALAKSLLGYVLGGKNELVFSSLQKLAMKPVRINKLIERYSEQNGSSLVDDIKGSMTGSDLQLALELIGMKPEDADSLFNSDLPADDLAYSTLAADLKGLLEAETINAPAIFARLLPISGRPDSVASLKKAYTTLTGGTAKALEEAFVAKLTGNTVFYALYLLNAPPPNMNSFGGEGLSWTGDENFNVSAGGGNVTQQTDLTISREGNPTSTQADFSVEYAGGLSESSRWLQFVSRTLEYSETGSTDRQYVGATNDDGSKIPYEFTTDPNDPVYSVDVMLGAPAPFYEEASPSEPENPGANIRNPSATTIFDSPGSGLTWAAYIFDNPDVFPNVEKVYSTAYFYTFLIRDFFPIVRINHIRVAEFTRKPDANEEDPPHVKYPMTETHTQEVKGSAPLPGPMKEVLVKYYPEFSYIASK
ncbi:MAG: hypothetical protein FD123_2654 [Bacteroidetes bacterium]|nr:MAG: hypothetical protein FD123_2654 [Bacteroidota bacterium]